MDFGDYPAKISEDELNFGTSPIVS
jgi:hypothetical protein